MEASEVGGCKIQITQENNLLDTVHIDSFCYTINQNLQKLYINPA